MSSEDLKTQDLSQQRSSPTAALPPIAHEKDHPIRYRSCSWQKTTALLMSEYICLAILSFPWSFSVLGMVPGVIVTISVAASVQYTSYILWKFCMKHPEVRDVCDIGRIIFGGSELAYNLTGLMFILNNTFIQVPLETLTNSSECTIVFSAITAIICFVVSLPRTLNQLAGLGTFSAVTMGLAVLLAVIFSGIQTHPAGFTTELGAPIVTSVPVPGTTFVLGMSAFLNISYTLIGQITLPSEPRDFPKALAAVTICEVVVFTLCGNHKIAFSFAIPTIIYLGSLYSSVTARFVFFRIYAKSEHRYSNTVKGWFVWSGIIAVTWVLAFIIAEIIPFFNGWFGFVYWAMCYLILYPPSERWSSMWRSAETLLNYFLILFGLYMTVAGTYVSIQSIIDSYNASAVGSVFTCVSNAL
ncbi:hypothetical protein B0H14DRAFT_2958689 [Mycena olivaceomarginata]|nr:hypothetical protein B0H14DRAFT_2958689 [Mycena olivaceomarginata]